MPPLSSKILLVGLVIVTVIAFIIKGIFWTAQRTDKAFSTDNPTSITHGPSENETNITRKDLSVRNDEQPHFHSSARVTSDKSPSLKTVEERQRYYDDLLTKPPDILWQEWVHLLNTGDQTRIEYATNALAQKLQQGENEDIYGEVATVLNQPALSPEQKSLLVNLLTETATLQALQIMLSAIDNEADGLLQTSLEEGIERVGDNHWGARFHPELSPPLEAAWGQFADPTLLSSLAIGIAKVGATNGIILLLNEIARSDQTLDGLRSGNNPRALVALEAMRYISNPDAVPILAKGLTDYHTGHATFIASGEGLSAIASLEATSALLDWAKQAPDNAAPLAREWLGQVRDRGINNADLMRNAIADGNTFRSISVKNEIIELVRLLDSASE